MLQAAGIAAKTGVVLRDILGISDLEYCIQQFEFSANERGVVDWRQIVSQKGRKIVVSLTPRRMVNEMAVPEEVLVLPVCRVATVYSLTNTAPPGSRLRAGCRFVMESGRLGKAECFACSG